MSGLYGGSLTDFLGHEEPDEDDTGDWAIRGIIAKAQPGALGGDPKTGKTMLAEDWAISLAMGAPDWCGFEIPERARVLIMPREDAERTTRIRLWQLARGHNIDPRELDTWLEVDGLSPLNFGEKEDADKLKRTAENFDVMLIDSLSTIHRGDENSSRDAGIVGGVWRDVSLATGTAVVLVHHFNGKGNADDSRGPGHRLRGSSKFFADCRHVVGVKRANGSSTLTVETQGNLYFQPDPFAIELVREENEPGKVGICYRNLGPASDVKHAKVREAIIKAAMSQPGISKRAIRESVREQLGKSSNGVVDEALARLEMDGLLIQPSPRGGWYQSQ